MKGALLIGLAVVIGVVLLQQVDKTKPGAVAVTTTTRPKTTTTTVPSTSSVSTTTTVAAQPAKQPAELKVIVLNGGAQSGAAGTMSTQLRGQGYTNQLPANDWTGHQQTGNTVMCKPGLTRDASALAVAVGKGTPVPTVAYASNVPSYATSADCVVVVGG